MRFKRTLCRSASLPMAGGPAGLGRLALVYCLLLLLASLRSSAGGATITGRITYGNGAPAASLIVQVSHVWAYTDVRGYYRLNDVPFGEQRMQVRYGDKILKVIRIEVNKQRVVVDQTL